MKKIYIEPEIEVVRFDTEDVITTSNESSNPIIDEAEDEL